MGSGPFCFAGYYKAEMGLLRSYGDTRLDTAPAPGSHANLIGSAKSESKLSHSKAARGRRSGEG
jgi:hypothetical protein